MHACVTGGQQKLFDPVSNIDLIISRLSSLWTTERVLLKAHSTGLATSESANLLGMLDKIEMEM